MSDHAKSPSGSQRTTPGPAARYGLAWVPIPVLLLTILALWVADLRTPYESRAMMVLLNVFFTWLASLCICVLAARGFLASGQPGLLMFGCGSLIWGVTSLSAAMIVDRVNPTVSARATRVPNEPIISLPMSSPATFFTTMPPVFTIFPSTVAKCSPMIMSRAVP